MNNENGVPRHVAIILDGNGRWAKQRNMPRSFGHKEGCKVIEQTVYDAGELGIEYLTAYGFSTENWKRSDEEVTGLMKLFRIYMKRLMGIAKENNVRVKSIGDRRRFPEDIASGLDDLEEQTKDNTGLTFIIALNYGARDEITRAVKKVAEEVREGALSPEDITEDVIASHLDTAGIPDPDLLIRTGGEMRLSNYLLYQAAYTEFYVTDVLWPDFRMEDLKKAVEWYMHRERRFGGVKQEQTT